MAYISPKEYAAKHGKSAQRIRHFCAEGRIRGARFVGVGSRGVWQIPEDAAPPAGRKKVRG
jgi:hypothetical protein